MQISNRKLYYSPSKLFFMYAVYIIIFMVVSLLVIALVAYCWDSIEKNEKKAESQEFLSFFINSSCRNILGEGPVVLDEKYSVQASFLGFPIKQYAKDRRLCPIIMWNDKKCGYEVIGAKKQFLKETYEIEPGCKLIVETDGMVSEKNFSSPPHKQWHNLHDDARFLSENENVSAEEYFATKEANFS